MKQRERETSQRVMHSTEKPGDHGDGALSAPMRQLILSFVRTDSNRTWDAAAYTRRPSLTAASEAFEVG